MAAQQTEKCRGGVLMNVIGILLCVIFIPVILANLVLIVKTYTDSTISLASWATDR